MKRRSTFLSIAIFSCFIATAQTGKINGVVQDGSSKTISSATVSLLRVKDSSVLKFAPTNKTGEYEFLDIPDGKYFVSATSVGYGKVRGEAFAISSSNPSVKLPLLVMKEQAKSLGGVTVTARKPFIETRID